MIREITLEQSKNFHYYKYNTRFYTHGIKADTCIIIDNLETYYNKKEEVIYVDSHEYYNKTEPGESSEITKDMLNELITYLGWHYWSINLYYYDYEEAMIIIKRNDTEYLSEMDKLEMDILTDDLIQNKNTKQSLSSYY